MFCDATDSIPVVISFEDFVKNKNASSKVNNLVDVVKSNSRLKKTKKNSLATDIVANKISLTGDQDIFKSKTPISLTDFVVGNHSSNRKDCPLSETKKEKLTLKRSKRIILSDACDIDEVICVDDVCKQYKKQKLSKVNSESENFGKKSISLHQVLETKKKPINNDDVTIVSITPSFNKNNGIPALAPGKAIMQTVENFFSHIFIHQNLFFLF